MASPFADAMRMVLANPQVPTFSEQGEAVGKTKGRKRAPAKTKEAETVKSKRSKKQRTDQDAQGQDECKVDVPPLESITDQLTPPPHVTAGHVYSTAYRKHLSLYGKLDVAGAQKAAKLASAIFQAYGIVSSQQVGKFKEKPRKPATPNAPPAPPPANGVEPAN